MFSFSLFRCLCFQFPSKFEESDLCREKWEPSQVLKPHSWTMAQHSKRQLHYDHYAALCCTSSSFPQKPFLNSEKSRDSRAGRYLRVCCDPDATVGVKHMFSRTRKCAIPAFPQCFLSSELYIFCTCC